MAKLIVGCGYLGQRVCNQWQATGEKVFVITRNPEKAQKLAAQNCHPIVVDICDPAGLSDAISDLENISSVLFSVGFDRNSDQQIEDVYLDGCRNVVTALTKKTSENLTFFYISSTGVYGHGGGSLVSEQTDCNPVRDGGRACLATENYLRSSELSDNVIVLRLAGIYGPGRLPNRAVLESGTPLKSDPDSYLNLIHVEDAAKIVLQCEESVGAPNLLNVCLGHPVLRRDYFGELATQFGLAAPMFSNPADIDPNARGSMNKRVDNSKLKKSLKLDLLYPTYADGIRAALNSSS